MSGENGGRPVYTRSSHCESGPPKSWKGANPRHLKHGQQADKSDVFLASAAAADGFGSRLLFEFVTRNLILNATL